MKMNTDGWKLCTLLLEIPPQPVKRVEQLGRQEFLDEYAERRPALVTGGVRH